MTKKSENDLDFELAFYESVLKYSPKYATVLEILGSLYTKAGRVNDGFQMDLQLIELQPENNLAHYNLACSQSLLGKYEDALDSLRTAIYHGYEDYEWMLKDPDLFNLRNIPEFNEIVVSLKNKVG